MNGISHLLGRAIVVTQSNRIDGWKAIGAHFGRDRTTVMRWARERGLPVRRIPGGKTGTVYALKGDLDQWAAGQSGLNEDVPALGPAPVWRRYRWTALSLAAVVAVVVLLAVFTLPHGRPARDLPSDPVAADLFLKARDQWAQRTPETLQHAIAGFEATVAREPGFAPAWAGLSEAYLLSREFGAMPDKTAFDKARTAADRALKLDPSLAAAHRARGFILYWWDDRPREAGRAFRRALDLAPDSAQTHFWYGNILADNGQNVAALRELNAARLREPGSVPIQTDLAWAQWSAGDERAARAALVELARNHPEFAVVHDCLRMIYLADGDYVGYVQALDDYAHLLKDDKLVRHAADLRVALKAGAPEVHRLLLDHALSELKAGTIRTHRWPVFLTSVAQDRKETVALLLAAERRHETWGEAGTTSRIQRLWIDDAEITDLVRRRKPEPVE